MAARDSGWRGWIRMRRMVPLLTIATALVAGTAAALGKGSPEVIQGVIISMLSLLALDALVERVDIIEKIETRLSKLDAPSLLKDRSELMPLQALALGGTSIAACGVTLHTLVSPHFDYFAEKIAAGCTIQLLILDPSTTAYRAWHEAQRIASPEDTQVVLRTVESLVRAGKGIEVRLAPWHLPVSLVVIDARLETGRMNVEFAFTSLSLPNRPHMHLTRKASPEWFQFFVDRFEYLWGISKPWTPPSAVKST